MVFMFTWFMYKFLNDMNREMGEKEVHAANLPVVKCHI